ncbi:MAG: UvrD-helicase domain-containing protein [Spirochaetes bacterium]|nr:UvrD-helicase domain-containing protein [Spirochaetota bacterium]
MKLDIDSLLNERQAEAVRSTEGPLLILAGAGSGKTRVVTWRIAFLLEKGVSQSEILAVTFTNKAAREMAQRVKELVPRRLSRLSVSTFHAFGAKVLREHAGLLGWRPNFTIYDAQDQVQLVKRTARELGVKTESFDAKKTASLVSSVKTGRLALRKAPRELTALYKEYQANRKLYNAVDFDDLIMLPIELLKTRPEVRQAYQERFRYLLVDEFQDTSEAQYDLMRLLSGPAGNVCVVGDDDQSIYSWRGADYANILRFERDFPGLREVTLDQNYRSTPTILRAANGLIAHNADRKGKRLWSGLGDGERIEVVAAGDEHEEAAFIVSTVRMLGIRESVRYHDVAVLVRANHLTRAIEEEFLKERIPYRVSGGMSFFERQEVRDLLAYLRLTANHDDDVSLLRIINTPRRGIGRKALERAVETAGRRGCSLFSAFTALVAADGGLEERAREAVGEFLDLVAEYRQRFLGRKAKLSQTLRDLIDAIDYWPHLVSEYKDQETARWKLGNVEALAGSLADYESDPDTVDPSLFDWLARVALSSRDDLSEDDPSGKVNLMTIHAAKGLEFPVVFVAAVEKDIIPHSRSLAEPEPDSYESPGSVEEERRLFYVAITRAKRRLYLSHCASRRRMGKETECEPSPFLDELPGECLASPAAEEYLSDKEAERMFAEARQRMMGKKPTGTP